MGILGKLFKELYEIFSTFRTLADDSEPRLEISTEPVPEAEAIHHLIACLIARRAVVDGTFCHFGLTYGSARSIRKGRRKGQEFACSYHATLTLGEPHRGLPRRLP